MAGKRKKNPEDAVYNKEIAARTAWARQAAGYTQEEMAGFLGMKQDTYKNYEIDSPLPRRVTATFCRLTWCDLYWFMTGEGTRPEPRPGVAAPVGAMAAARRRRGRRRAS